jgi:hypothetical protein
VLLVIRDMMGFRGASNRTASLVPDASTVDTSLYSNTHPVISTCGV